jgi:hypothetical protein
MLSAVINCRKIGTAAAVSVRGRTTRAASFPPLGELPIEVILPALPNVRNGQNGRSRQVHVNGAEAQMKNEERATNNEE